MSGNDGNNVIEDPLDCLVAIVRDHYTKNTAPLLLSRFGQTNKQLLAALKERFGSLSAAVKAAGDERLRIVDTTIGRESMASANVADEVGQKIKERSANQKQDGSNFDSLPGAVQIAFCVRSEAHEFVGVRVTPPFHYEKVASLELLRPSYRHLADHYRKPGLVLRTATLQDRETLWRAFVAWTAEQKIDPAAFNPIDQTNALARLLGAQSADVLGRLVIPADIAAILLKRP